MKTAKTTVPAEGRALPERTTSWLFSPKSKLADLIQANYKLLFVLRRLGIALGFGEIKVEEMCRRYAISPDFFLLICRIHSNENPLLPDDWLQRLPVNELIDYLHRSHLYYAHQIPVLRNKIQEMARSCEPIHLKILERFLDDYQQETDHHFAYEEETVFPYIHQLVAGHPGNGYNIEQFEHNHSNIEEKLHDLQNIVLKYLPESCQPELRDEVLFDIFLLEEDLHKHTLLENQLLIPYVAQLESHENR